MSTTKNPTRKAVVAGSRTSLETVQRYLPHNYEAHIVHHLGDDPVILIHGKDNAGWTLDGYVIPRLASGLIFAKEVEVEVEVEPDIAPVFIVHLGTGTVLPLAECIALSWEPNEDDDAGVLASLAFTRDNDLTVDPTASNYKKGDVRVIALHNAGHNEDGDLVREFTLIGGPQDTVLQERLVGIGAWDDRSVEVV